MSIETVRSPVPVHMPTALFNGHSVWPMWGRPPAAPRELGQSVKVKLDDARILTVEQGRQLARLVELQRNMLSGGVGVWDNGPGFLPNSKLPFKTEGSAA